MQEIDVNQFAAMPDLISTPNTGNHLGRNRPTK